jgi:hypothetical protein
MQGIIMSSLRDLYGSSYIIPPATKRVAQKIPKLSFRGRGSPEESASFSGLAKKQLPRFARDDIKLLFSAAAKASRIPHTLRHV